MKNNLIMILFVILLSLSGCSSVDNTKPQNVEANSVTAVNVEDEETVKEHKSDLSNNASVDEDKTVENVEQQSINENVKTEDANTGNESSTNSSENNQTIPVNNSATTEESANNSVEEQALKTAEEQAREENLLKIQGLVENELKLSLEELKTMDNLIFEDDFYWLNSFGSTGYTHFKGIHLWKLLESKALVKAEATIVTVIAQDGYKMEFTLDQVKKTDYMDETNPDKKYPMIIAWQENGEEYKANKGAPYKLVVGQKQAGDTNKPQWVSNIDKIIVE